MLALVSAQAHAIDWPTKPVTIYVTTAAGGNTDLMARMAAEYLSAKFGKTFVVENRPSAGGAAASGPVAGAAPDGYAVLFTPGDFGDGSEAAGAKDEFRSRQKSYAGEQCGTVSQVLAVKRSLPVNNLAEFLAHAKANPRKLNYAVAGTNNISHLAPVLLFERAGVELVMVPVSR